MPHNLWADDRHWTRWGFYRCAEDPPLIVPKRVWWTGWTANIGHGLTIRTITVFSGILLLAVAPPLAAMVLWPESWSAVAVSGAFSLALVSGVCHYLATRETQPKIEPVVL